MDEPKLYSKENSLQTTDNIHVIEKYLNLMRWENEGGLTALDVGCGEGRTTAEILLPKLPPSVSKLVGGDISDKMVKFAKESFPDPRLDFCRLDLSDVTACNVFADAFDRIFSFYCLHWIPDQRRAFENLYNVLKPGGELLLSFLGTNPIFDVYLNISKNIRWAPYFREEMVSPYHNCPDPQGTIERLLGDVGFEHWKCFVEDRQFVFPSWKQVKEAVTGVNPIIPKLQLGDQAQYMKDFIKEVTNIYSKTLKWCDNNNDGPVPVNYKLIVVYATKPKL